MGLGRPFLTRRTFGTGLAGITALFSVKEAAQAHVPAPSSSPFEAEMREAALRGLALASHRQDPVEAAKAEAALTHLEQADPEAALLGRIYQLLDIRPAAYWQEDREAEAAACDLAALHSAIRACQPVVFDYTDLAGQSTRRKVLPLVLVHPPQGVKLLAWCQKRGDFRQFFVRSLRNLSLQPGHFGKDRLALLQGLLDKETNRA